MSLLHIATTTASFLVTCTTAFLTYPLTCYNFLVIPGTHTVTCSSICLQSSLASPPPVCSSATLASLPLSQKTRRCEYHVSPAISPVKIGVGECVGTDRVGLAGSSGSGPVVRVARSAERVLMSWDKVLTRIKQFPTQAAVVAELFFQNELGATAFAVAAANSAPVEVLESMINKAKLDVKKRNILGAAYIVLFLPLHYAASHHPDPAAIKLLVIHHPQALLAKRTYGDIPLDFATRNNTIPAVVSLARELAAARLATIALRTTLLLCIKHGYVYVRRSKRHRTATFALDVPLAFEVLNDNVWSHIMTFL